MVAIHADRIHSLSVGPRPAEARPNHLPRGFAEAQKAPRHTARRDNAQAAPDRRQNHRRAGAMRAWIMSLEGASRGYALDVSETGARLGGVCSPLGLNERALCKIELRPNEEPLVVRAEIVRNDGQDAAVRFVDLNLDEWFRLARFVDAANGRSC